MSTAQVFPPLAAARALSGEIRAAAAEVEQRGRLSPELVGALVRAGVFQLCVPAAYGGLEAELGQTLEVLEEIARADGATGWCAMIGATSALVSAYLEEPAARAVYGDPAVITGGVAAPRGRARAVEGGYRVTGRWPFASGCQHSQWLMGGCVVFDGEAPRMREGGGPVTRLLLFPASSVTIHDTWRVSGLRGTGSHDIEVNDLFVPEAYGISLTHGRPRLSGPLYAIPLFGALALGVAAVTLGIARGALDELARVATAKTPFGTTRPLAARPTLQVQLAEAEGALRAARALLFEEAAAASEVARAGDALGVPRRAGLRLAATHATQSAARVVDVAYHAAGATSLYEASPLQRSFRDVHAATQHAMVSPAIYELCGRVQLGLEIDASTL